MSRTSLGLAVLMLGLSPAFSAPVSAQPPASAQQDAKRAERTAKVKAGIQKLGTGSNSVVKVTLYDKTEYKGVVSRAGENDFEITTKTGQQHVVNYADVKSIGGKNLSTGAKIGIGIGIGAGLTILLLLLIIEHYG